MDDNHTVCSVSFQSLTWIHFCQTHSAIMVLLKEMDHLGKLFQIDLESHTSH